MTTTFKQTLLRHLSKVLLAAVVVAALNPDGLAQSQGQASLYIEVGHLMQDDGIDPSVAFAESGRLFASVQGGYVKIWSVASGIELATFRPTNGCDRLWFVSDDKSILCTFRTGVEEWNIQSAKVVRDWMKESFAGDVAFHRGAKSLARLDFNGVVSIIDFRSGGVRPLAPKLNENSAALAFSSDGKRLAAIDQSGKLRVWDVVSGRLSLDFSTGLGSAVWMGFVKGRNVIAVSTGDSFKFVDLVGRKVAAGFDAPQPIAVSEDGSLAAFESKEDGEILIRRISGDGEFVARARLQFEKADLMIPPGGGFSIDNGLLAVFPSDSPSIRVIDVGSGAVVHTATSRARIVTAMTPNPNNGSFLVQSGSGVWEWDLNGNSSWPRSSVLPGLSKLRLSRSGFTAVGERSDDFIVIDVRSGKETARFPVGHERAVEVITLSRDGATFASGSEDRTIKIWSVAEGLLQTLEGNSGEVTNLAFSPDGRELASSTRDGDEIRIWRLGSSEPLEVVELAGSFGQFDSLAFSEDGMQVYLSAGGGVQVYDRGTKQIRKLERRDATDESRIFPFWSEELARTVPDLYRNDGQFSFLESSSIYLERERFYRSLDFRAEGDGAEVRVMDARNGAHLASIVELQDGAWVVTTPDGRFDTSADLDKVPGVHWVIDGKFDEPLPLEILMRQYFEPNLLQRAVKCHQERSCDSEFKPLPPLSQINRAQPKVAIGSVGPIVIDASGTPRVDVTVEAESVTGSDGRTVSGVYDLRLFRDGQLVGSAVPEEVQLGFVKSAPRLVAETKASGRLLNTPEDEAWRKAHGLALDPKTGRATYIFKGVALPRAGAGTVAFTAYAFNADRVKSQTAELRYEVPGALKADVRKGRAYVVSIGVNDSETERLRLKYAAADAREAQRVLSDRLEASGGQYSEVVRIPLISDYDRNMSPTETGARKEVIRGVFMLLAGKRASVPPEVLKVIPNADRIDEVAPEDTVVITFSGHGYTDQSGIFYLLPSDIGKGAVLKSADSLSRTISSDELSLWMRDITANEMIMIIDACYSSAAVQGDGFKPGPMGSRGLGQLAYDKGMRILSATQADNVAIELGSLGQGLLSFALLRDGIEERRADTDKDGVLSAKEWLSHAERRVPELYQDVKDGKRGVLIDGKPLSGSGIRSDEVCLSDCVKSAVNLQRPTLFDFRRRGGGGRLLSLR